MTSTIYSMKTNELERQARNGNQIALRRAVNRFQPIRLEQMTTVALLNRTDTKFVLRLDQVVTALHELCGDYRMLDVAGTRLNHYQTLYFDTPSFDLYLAHHAGVPNRYKVRSRRYVESDLSFLEVKQKCGNKRTIKDRMETDSLLLTLDADAHEFLAGSYPFATDELVPKLWNRFTRLTLVSKHRPERLTIDLELGFEWGWQRAELGGIAVVELKQEGHDRGSEFLGYLRQMNAHATSFSKYCMAIGLLYPHLKNNNFKAQRLLVERLSQERYHG